jgi:O-acetyl-ADP-ribose deacetylase (regulator of RNase III)
VNFCKIRVVDILQSGADIIVLSANPSLLAGSGISGVIHKAAGEELEMTAKALGPIKVGEAIITPAFNLTARYVIHTVCPRYMNGQKSERELLGKAYRSALSFYNEVPNVRSISFVSMGTGVYRWPLELAAEIAIKELAQSKFEETTMCVIDELARTTYKRIRSNKVNGHE